ncbi:MAG: hypothetical protein BWY06_03296 [Candidatus Latescibacteria bacterium ADurb.Bin168]|nr:MAG: hypothetical protein BWY06_03296 [Candidatus Latescibacteria bacterium ADurb.Bin168]
MSRTAFGVAHNMFLPVISMDMMRVSRPTASRPVFADAGEPSTCIKSSCPCAISYWNTLPSRSTPRRMRVLGSRLERLSPSTTNFAYGFSPVGLPSADACSSISACACAFADGRREGVTSRMNAPSPGLLW